MVIGLTGLATVGKSAVADILVRDYGFEKRSFAAPLKEMLRTLDPILGYRHNYLDLRDELGKAIAEGAWTVRLSHLIDGGWSEGDIKDSIYGAEYRRLLQVLGTDCIRAIDDDFWIKAAMKTLTDPDGKYVFDDCRFPNEAEMIYEFNEGTISVGDVWHVTRPGVELAPDAHESEQHAGHMGETVEIHNDGSLERLKETVDIAMNFIAAPRRMMTGVRIDWTPDD